MTVMELMIKLQEFPPDMEVCIFQSDPEWPGYNQDILSVEIKPKEEDTALGGPVDTTPIVCLS